MPVGGAANAKSHCRISNSPYHAVRQIFPCYFSFQFIPQIFDHHGTSQDSTSLGIMSSEVESNLRTSIALRIPLAAPYLSCDAKDRNVPAVAQVSYL